MYDETPGAPRAPGPVDPPCLPRWMQMRRKIGIGSEANMGRFPKGEEGNGMPLNRPLHKSGARKTACLAASKERYAATKTSAQHQLQELGVMFHSCFVVELF